MKYILLPQTKAQMAALYQRLLSLGYCHKGYPSLTDYDKWIKYFPDSLNNNWRRITIDCEHKHFECFSPSNISVGQSCAQISFEDLFSDDFGKPPYMSVTLNSRHTAHVYKDKVIVGCEAFPITAIDDLVTARDAINKKL